MDDVEEFAFVCTEFGRSERDDEIEREEGKNETDEIREEAKTKKMVAPASEQSSTSTFPNSSVVVISNFT